MPLDPLIVSLEAGQVALLARLVAVFVVLLVPDLVIDSPLIGVNFLCYNATLRR